MRRHEFLKIFGGDAAFSKPAFRIAATARSLEQTYRIRRAMMGRPGWKGIVRMRSLPRNRPL